MMRKLDLDALAKLADDNDQPRMNVYVAAFVQSYIGELEKVLMGLMVLVAAVPVLFFLMWWQGDVPGLMVVAVFILSLGVGAVLFIEHLYCSKGKSFLTTVTGIARALCPDKNYLHRSDEIAETLREIKALLGAPEGGR